MYKNSNQPKKKLQPKKKKNKEKNPPGTNKRG